MHIQLILYTLLSVESILRWRCLVTILKAKFTTKIVSHQVHAGLSTLLAVQLRQQQCSIPSNRWIMYTWFSAPTLRHVQGCLWIVQVYSPQAAVTSIGNGDKGPCSSHSCGDCYRNRELSCNCTLSSRFLVKIA